jgi:hypothetical protein
MFKLIQRHFLSLWICRESDFLMKKRGLRIRRCVKNIPTLILLICDGKPLRPRRDAPIRRTRLAGANPVFLLEELNLLKLAKLERGYFC